MQLRDITPYLMHLQFVECVGIRKLYQHLDIARVARGGVGGEPALVREMRKKIRQMLLRRRGRLTLG